MKCLVSAAVLQLLGKRDGDSDADRLGGKSRPPVLEASRSHYGRRPRHRRL
jgi:hypothetical protein